METKSKKASIALIPARGGSKRLPRKNLKLFQGLPLIAHSILSAIESDEFNEILVSTDDSEIATVAREYGAEVPGLRPQDLAGDMTSDIEWVMYAIENQISTMRQDVEFLAILRPTSPLRQADTIRRAFENIRSKPWADSLRAMQPVSEHPGKMWIVNDMAEAQPYLNQLGECVPTHSRPTQSLPHLWVQNASLEIVRMSAVLETKSISGKRVAAFQMPGFEGFDVNTETDFQFLEFISDMSRWS